MPLNNLANHQAMLANYGGGGTEEFRDPEIEQAYAERFIHLQYIIANLLEKNERLRRLIVTSSEIVDSVPSATQ